MDDQEKVGGFHLRCSLPWKTLACLRDPGYSQLFEPAVVKSPLVRLGVGERSRFPKEKSMARLIRLTGVMVVLGIVCLAGLAQQPGQKQPIQLKGKKATGVQPAFPGQMPAGFPPGAK